LPNAPPLACSRKFYSAASVKKPTSGGFANLLGTLRKMGMIDYPGRGHFIPDGSCLDMKLNLGCCRSSRP
jgi:hypothetical protein